MASSLRNAQVPIRARGSNKCPHHAGKEVIFACEDCGELACSKCVSSLHRKHAVDDIIEIIPQVKTTIQDFVNKTENGYIPKLDQNLKNLADKIFRNKNHSKAIISRIAKQNETLKRELDKITETMIALCREVENKNDDILKRHRLELQSKIEELNAQLLELKDILQSGTNVQIYDTSREIPSGVTISALPSVQELDFIPTSFSINQLEKLMGEGFQPTGESRTQTKSSDVTDQQSVDVVRGSEKENYKKRPQSKGCAKGVHNPDKLSKRNVETFVEFQTEEFKYSINSICATSSNQAWISHSNELELLNNTGTTRMKMKMEVHITDFCVSSSTADVWFCSCNDNSVRKVTEDNTSTVKFYTDSKPLSICISAGNILVGMEGQVVKYTQRGKISCKSTKVKQVPVVRYPRRISNCPVTRNIAVLDWDNIDSGGDDRKRVSILSEDLQLLCRYYGRDIKSFCPWDVCYSDTGDIYIADFGNGSIQQISGRGEFMKTVFREIVKSANDLCVQPNGDIWAVFGLKSVIILQKQ